MRQRHKRETTTKKKEGQKKRGWERKKRRKERKGGREGGGLHQLFERGMHKRSHSSLHCCGLPYVQLSLARSLSPSLSFFI